MDKESEGSYAHVLKYTGVFGGVQGLNIIIGLVRNKLVALLLGPSGMGLTSLFNTSVSFISQATNLGVAFSGVRHVAELYERGDEAALEHYVKVVRGWCLLTALFGMLLCVVLGPWLSATTFAWGDHTLHFVLLAPAIGMLAITGGETAILKGMRRLGALAWVQVLSVVAALLISVPVYYFFGEAAIVPVIVMMTFVTMALTLRCSHKAIAYRLNGAYGVLGDGMGMVRLGVAYTLAAIVGSGAEMVIRAYLNVKGNPDLVGLYNAGYMLTITYAGIVFSAMESDYFPRLSAVQASIQETNDVVNRQMEVSLLLIAPMLAGLIILLPVLIPLLFSAQFLPVVGMSQVSALAMYLKVLTLPVAYITLARGRSLVYLILESSYFVILIILIIFGYERWGLYGTGVAITLAHLIDYLMINWVAYQKYGYRCSVTVFRYAFVQLLLGLSAFVLTVTTSGVTYWMIGGLIILSSCAYSFYILHGKAHLWQALMRRLHRKG